MGEYLVFVVLFILCWPVALLALVLYPIVWLLLLPFRLVGIAVEGVLQFLRACFRRVSWERRSDWGLRSGSRGRRSAGSQATGVNWRGPTIRTR